MPEKIPVFKSEEEEADFWDKHSPLDFFEDPEAEAVVVKLPKDQVVCIRLDSENLKKLKRLAADHNVGPSTLARLILMSALRNRRP